MSAFVANVFKNLLPWLKDSLVGWIKNWLTKRKRRQEVDSQVKRITKVTSKIKNEEMTEEQKKELIDASRILIDIDKL